VYEHRQKELQHTVLEKSLDDLGHMAKETDQVNTSLNDCFCLLKDPEAVSELTQ
jgi:hypothetical protein